VAERLVADPSAFELSPDKLEGEFVLLSPVDHSESFQIGDAPLLVLPIRLETRFAGDDLKIRVYPDQLQLDDHAPLLTEREVALGVAYWQRRLDGEPDAARDDLVRELPPRRAVWVARESRPTQGPKGIGWVFPDLKTRAANPPATAALMPDRWCAIGFLGNERAFVAWGQELERPLHCSPDLADLVPYDGGEEALPVDEDMAWMVDYERALDVGMAITVDVSELDIGSDGLTLFVAGVRDALDNETALVSLLEAHHYTDGLDVLAQGTPTNNTDEAIAGWSAVVDDVAGLFERELDGVGLAGNTRSAASQLASALGLGNDTVLRRLPGAVPNEDAAMAAMNRALWPVTWGRYIDDLLAPEEGPSILAPAKHVAIREFFCEHVRGGRRCPRSWSARIPTACFRSCGATAATCTQRIPCSPSRGCCWSCASAGARHCPASPASIPWTSPRTRRQSRCSACCPTPSASWSAGSPSSSTSARGFGRVCGRPRRAPTSPSSPPSIGMAASSGRSRTPSRSTTSSHF